MIDVQSYILSKFPLNRFNSNGRLHTKCPFHSDNSPSFSISDEGLFICGSSRCGVRGNFFQFYKLMEGIQDWKEVYAKLKVDRPKVSISIEDLLGIKNVKNKELQINDFPIEPFIQRPISENIPYLRNRYIDNRIIEYFNVYLGVGGKFYKVNINNSLVIPIYDIDGSYLTFQVRHLGIGIKKRWEDPIGSSCQHLLYGGWLINSSTNYLWIVEGSSDVWNLCNHGLQAVGLFTKEATSRQLNLIVKLCKNFDLIPVVCLDGDAVSDKFDYNLKIYNELYAFGVRPKIIYLKQHEDPGELSQFRINELIEILGKSHEGNTKSRSSDGR